MARNRTKKEQTTEVNTNGRNNPGMDRGNGTGTTRSALDNPALYAYNEQVAIDNATLNFATISGAPFDLDPGNRFANNSGVTHVTVNGGILRDKTFPGILALYWQPTIGGDASPESPLNQAAFNLFVNARRAAKITFSYDAPDLMKYCLYMSSLYALYAHLNRIYGLVNLYVRENNYLPKAMLKVLGVDVNDLVANLSNYRAWLNNLGLFLSKFAVPTGLGIGARWTALMSSIFTDSASPKSQFYVYVPDFFWQYTETSGDMTSVSWPGSTGVNMTFEAIQFYVRQFTDTLSNNGDFMQMSDNIMVAYPTDLVQLPIVTVESICVPELSYTALSLVQNSRAVGYLSTPTITADPNTNLLYLKYRSFNIPEELRPGIGYSLPAVYNTTANATAPMDVLKGTAQMVIAENESMSSTGGVTVDSTLIGSEVVSRYQIFYYVKGSDGIMTLSSTPAFTSIIRNSSYATSGDGLADFTDIISHLSHFDWHPFVVVEAMTKGDTVNPPYFTLDSFEHLGDVDNYTIVDSNTLRNLHRTVLLTLFQIPKSTRNYSA